MEFLFILHCLSFLSVPIKRCEKITIKVLIESLRIQLITSQKQPLAPRDIINNVPAVNRCRVFGMYFITSLTSENLPVYNLDK